MKKTIYALLILLVFNVIISSINLSNYMHERYKKDIDSINEISLHKINLRYEFSSLNDQNMVVLDTCTGDHWIKWISPTGGNDIFLPDKVFEENKSESDCEVGTYSIVVINDQNYGVFNKKNGIIYTRYLHSNGGPDDWTKYTLNN